MILRICALVGLFGALALAGAYFYVPGVAALLAGETFRWEARKAEAAVGPNQLLVFRLMGPDGTSIKGAEISDIRLDMSPDGMEAMSAPVSADNATEPGTFAYRADLTMAGRWALHVTANIPGENSPINGEILFIARSSTIEKPASEIQLRKIVYYRNPMGLPDTSPIPKKDTMGMDYIPVYDDEVSAPAGTVRVSLDKVQRSGVTVEAVERRSMSRTIKAPGIVEPDESRVAAVTARFNGFIEELYVAVTGDKVKAGQPLAEIWIESPEILQKQADYLVAIKASGGKRTPDVQRADRNLRLFGFPEDAITRLKEGQQPVRAFTLKAVADGTVMEKSAMRGMRFQSGEMLFKTVDLSEMWVTADVPEREIGHIGVGQDAKVKFTAFPGEQFTGRVLLIHPELDRTTRTAKVRIALSNPEGRIKANFFAEVEFGSSGNAGQAIVVSSSAVIDSGNRQVVIVEREEGLFEPRDVKLGRRFDGITEVLSGLTVGERIVVSGNFLIDSESNLRAALKGLAGIGEQP
jgi:Cu(I)/Ag(I) efflux system membrane fusion protein